MKVCWNLTNLCNENCIYCFRELFEKPKSLEDNIKIIAKLKELGVNSITYAGGEPFLYADPLYGKCLNLLLCYSNLLGFENKIITNGLYLNEDNMDEYLPLLDKITFSLDSTNEYMNESIGCKREHYNHIKELLKIIKEKYPKIKIEINTVVTRNNIDELDYILEELSSNMDFSEVSRWKLLRFLPLRGNAIKNKDMLSISDMLFSEVEDKYKNETADFEITIKNTDAFDKNIIISPSGHIKKSKDCKEYEIITDIINTPTEEMVKKLGGHHV